MQAGSSYFDVGREGQLRKMSIAPNEPHRPLSRSRRLFVFGGALLGVLILVSTLFVWVYGSQDTKLSQSIGSVSGSRMQTQLSPTSTSGDAGEAFNPIRHSPSTLTPTLKRPTGTVGAGSAFTVTATQITEQFIGVSEAGYSDSFTLHN
jgi:hypothetical protein